MRVDAQGEVWLGVAKALADRDDVNAGINKLAGVCMAQRMKCHVRAMSMRFAKSLHAALRALGEGGLPSMSPNSRASSGSRGGQIADIERGPLSAISRHRSGVRQSQKRLRIGQRDIIDRRRPALGEIVD